MQHSVNQTYKKQNQKLLPATFKKGVIIQAYQNNWTADVYIVGNNQTILKGVPLALSIDATILQAGMKCRLDLFDETNPSDMVVAYVYGGGNLSIQRRVASGSANVTSGGITITHSLGVVPNLVAFIPTQSPDSTYTASVSPSGSVVVHQNIEVYQYNPATSTNIYLKAQSQSGNALSGMWIAAKL